MIKLKKEVNKTQLFKELTEIGKKRFEFTCEPDEDLKVFLDGAEALFKLSRLGDVITRFKYTVEKKQSFYNELKALLVKYDAELTIEAFGGNCQSDEKIVVDFKYDESFFEKENTGIVPQLVLGRWENGL